ncbi:MAG: alpha/beta fold hydrolase, partial [Mycobacteriales bacterium]
MSTTTHDDVTLYYETFGSDADPALLLVNGLGSQCINYKPELCEKFVARGLRVVRFDNRDVGLSSHLGNGARYTVDDMAGDGFAVLDAVGAETAHIAGWSMGGMIVQAMALANPERVLSLTSVMSAP